MLQFIRDRATGWIAWGIVILISIPFAVWGVHNYLSGGSAVDVAKVDGVEIGLREYQQAYQRQQAQLREALGNSLDAGAEERLRGVVLDRMVDREVLDHALRTAAMRVGDEQLAAAIQSQQAFQAEGSFAQPQYDAWLRSQGYSAAGFERDYRRSLLSEQFANGVRWSALATPDELQRFAALQLQRRRFAELVVAAAPLRESRTVADDAVRARYEQQPERYRSPEQVKVAYIEVSRDAIAQGIEVSDADLHALYDAQKLNYMRPERRDVSHILLALPADADDAAIAAARQTAVELRAEIVAGKAFADVARESSEDPGSAPSGGELGEIERGMMDAAFEETAFSLPVNEISEPVKSRFGWHLIKVREVSPGAVRPFEEVRQNLLEEARRREAETIFYEQVDRLANLAYEHPESLEPAADSLGVELRESSFFASDGSGAEGIPAEPGVISAAFSSEVLAGNNSEPIEFDEPRVLVLRAIDHQDAAQLSFEEVADRIREELVAETAADEAATHAAALLDKLEGGADPTQLATEQSLSWSEEKTVTRRDPALSADLAGLVYQMARPQGERARYDALQRDNGDVVIVALRGVEDGAVPEGEARAQAARALGSQFGEGEFEAVVSLLRSRASIERFEENLQ